VTCISLQFDVETNVNVITSIVKYGQVRAFAEFGALAQAVIAKLYIKNQQFYQTITLFLQPLVLTRFSHKILLDESKNIAKVRNFSGAIIFIDCVITFTEITIIL
jgi:hypothetical protein